MAEGDDHRGYRFSPLERRGLVVGLDGAQLATLATGVLVALAVLRGAGGGAGLVAAVGIVGLAVVAACWPLAGRTPVGWLPIASSWVVARRHPARVAVAGRSAAPAGVRLLAAPSSPGDEPLGVVRDAHAGTWGAVLPVGGPAFLLLDGDDKRRRLAAWGAVLASMARAGSLVHRLQWVERTAPVDAEDWEAPPSAALAPAACVASYRDLVGTGAVAGRAHEVLLVVAIRPRRGDRRLRAFGRGDAGACALLRRELRLLRGQLDRAELDPRRPLDLGELAACLRAGVEPDPARSRPRLAAVAAWPLAWRDTWAAVRVDGHWHATYWVAEWPRHEVGADFLTPLLFATGTRTVSVTMAPVPPHLAVREVESARTAELADAELRRRAGFLQTARHRRQAEGVAAREAELADGHGELRFSGYVSVSGATPAELDTGCAAVETAARQAGLELRRLYGQQADALTWTLPLGRGLA